MDLQKLKYFMEVAKSQHMTQAANNLHISQPALSRIISQLETDLNCKLFDRAGKSIRLNENGECVYESAVRIFRELQLMEEGLSNLTEGLHGRITFASSFPNREPDWVAAVVAEYVSTHQTVDFINVKMSTQSIETALINRQVDIAICDRPMMGTSIKWEKKLSEKLGVIMAADHPLAQYRVLDLRDIEGEYFFCNNDSSDVDDITSYICKKSGFRPKIRFRGDYPQLIGSMVATGAGVAFVSEGAFFHGYGEENNRTWNPQVVFRPIREHYCEREIGIAVLKERALPRVVQDFYSLLLNYDVDGYRKQLDERLHVILKG